MKLQLKHLAAYLPYGLKVKYDIEFSSEWELDIHNLNALTENDKLILRPLSDLAKEITHNGETFVPINKLKNLYGFDYMWSFVKNNNGSFNSNAVCMASINKLLEWHFDIFRLIENNLAININDLK